MDSQESPEPVEKRPKTTESTETAKSTASKQTRPQTLDGSDLEDGSGPVEERSKASEKYKTAKSTASKQKRPRTQDDSDLEDGSGPAEERPKASEKKKKTVKKPRAKKPQTEDDQHDLTYDFISIMRVRELDKQYETPSWHKNLDLRPIMQPVEQYSGAADLQFNEAHEKIGYPAGILVREKWASAVAGPLVIAKYLSYRSPIELSSFVDNIVCDIVRPAILFSNSRFTDSALSHSLSLSDYA
ncbi:hypothetical protein QQZ08_012562, partial [Neonectria magnoliae]